MTDPSGADARRQLQATEEQLSDDEYTGWLADTKEKVTNTTDRLALLYFSCYEIAGSAAWQQVTRMGDKNFAPLDPEVFKKRFVQRCNQLGIKSRTALGNPKIRKIHSVADDYPDDLNTRS